MASIRRRRGFSSTLVIPSEALTIKTLPSIARPAELLVLGTAFVAVALPNAAAAQEAVDTALVTEPLD